jgi:hypothetical protein
MQSAPELQLLSSHAMLPTICPLLGSGLGVRISSSLLEIRFSVSTSRVLPTNGAGRPISRVWTGKRSGSSGALACFPFTMVRRAAVNLPA